jgi:hypothetical protein
LPKVGLRVGEQRDDDKDPVGWGGEDPPDPFDGVALDQAPQRHD